MLWYLEQSGLSTSRNLNCDTPRQPMSAHIDSAVSFTNGQKKCHAVVCFGFPMTLAAIDGLSLAMNVQIFFLNYTGGLWPFIKDMAEKRKKNRNSFPKETLGAVWVNCLVGANKKTGLKWDTAEYSRQNTSTPLPHLAFLIFSWFLTTVLLFSLRLPLPYLLSLKFFASISLCHGSSSFCSSHVGHDWWIRWA